MTREAVIHPEITEALKTAIETLGVDTVLFRLSRLARDRRIEAETDEFLRCDVPYWRQMQRLLSEAAEKAAEIET